MAKKTNGRWLQPKEKWERRLAVAQSIVIRAKQELRKIELKRVKEAKKAWKKQVAFIEAQRIKGLKEHEKELLKQADIRFSLDEIKERELALAKKRKVLEAKLRS